MFYPLLFLIELLVLFILSKSLINHIYSFFYKFSKNKKLSIYALCIIFFTGTLIHEVSHYLMSVLLFVPAGNMTLFPKIVGDGVKLGSVEIAKTDPFRRIMIGMAPFLFGNLIILSLFFYAARTNLFYNYIFIIVVSYFVFEIGNTMFSSKRDMEGAFELVMTLILLSAIFYFVGIRLPAFNPGIIFSNPIFVQTLQKTDLYLAAPLAIDIIFIILLRIILHRSL